MPPSNTSNQEPPHTPAPSHTAALHASSRESPRIYLQVRLPASSQIFFNFSETCWLLWHSAREENLGPYRPASKGGPINRLFSTAQFPCVHSRKGIELYLWMTFCCLCRRHVFDICPSTFCWHWDQICISFLASWADHKESVQDECHDAQTPWSAASTTVKASVPQPRKPVWGQVFPSPRWGTYQGKVQTPPSPYSCTPHHLRFLRLEAPPSQQLDLGPAVP